MTLPSCVWLSGKQARHSAHSPLQVAQNWWLSRWADATAAADAAGGPLPAAESHMFLRAYFALGLSTLACALARNYALLTGSVSATRRLHARLLTRVWFRCTTALACTS